MAVLPSGSVTFLLTDIEGSTPLLRRLGDRYYLPLLERHDRLLRGVWERHGGVEFKSDGDALLVAFESAAAACAAAVDGQRQLAAEPWPADAVIRVRMGIHTGIAYPRHGDYVALALHQAARVVGAANGGHALASAATVAAAGTVFGVGFERIGAFRLRDFDGPAELWSVQPAGSPPETLTAIRAVPADGHNLRRPTDAFVGRQRELADVAALLGPGRAVTLVGPGGMGKTRLAVELGLAIAAAWPGGVWFVDLTTVPEGRSIESAVADALGIRSRQEDLVADLVEHVGASATLLVLDNCEHVLASSRSLTVAMLAGCPNAGILATSRERLGVPGEQSYLLAPLGAADEGVELFEERSREQDVSFRLASATDRALVEQICAVLDAMPLAIELAAARTTVLTPREILDGLEGRLTSLRSRSGALSPRQRSLDALLDWSYDLLSPDEQAALRRLSAFATSFDLRTAAAAVGWGEVPRHDVPELVWSLAEKSLALVERTEMSTRYRLLGTIRAVAAEHLQRAGEATTARRELAEQYLGVFSLDARGNRTWRSNLDVELPTLSELVGLLVDDGEVELGHALARLVVEHEIGLSLSRGLVAVDAALEAAPEASPGRARLALLAAKLRAEAGDLDASAVWLADALDQMERTGDVDRLGRIEPLHAKTQLVLRGGTPEEMARLDDELIGALAGGISLMERADLLNDRALVAGALGVRGASPLLEEALAIAEQLDDHMLWMTANNNLAEHDLREGDTAAAAHHQREAMRLSAELGVPLVTAFGLIVAARIAQPLGLDAEAVRLHGAADVMLEEIGFELMFDDRDLSDQMLDAAREALGEHFDIELDEGRLLDLADALALAELVYDKVAPPAEPAPSPLSR